MPKSFEDYNKQMRGVDLLNQFVSTYRVRIGQRNGMLQFQKRGCHDNSGIFWKK